MLAGSLNVDDRVASSGGDDELQVRQPLDHGAGQRCAFAHQDHDVVRQQPLRKPLGVGHMVAKGSHVGSSLNTGPVGHGQGHALVVVEHRNPQSHLPLSPSERISPGRSLPRRVDNNSHDIA